MPKTQTPAAVLGSLLVLTLPALSCSPQPPRATSAPPSVLGMDGTYLDAVRARMESGDRALESAVQSLQHDAQKALALAPMSVMDKPVVPPSGDKHDYMSQAPYWWPDTSKPGGRPYIRRDGDRNPEIDRMARRTLEVSRERIARHIEADGRQPRELERTRSWDYSIFNLRAFFQLAGLGERAGVDLWSHRTTDGRSLKVALDYLVPFAAGDRPWPHPQITTFRGGELDWLLRRAAVAWKEPQYRQVAERVGGGSPRLELVLGGHDPAAR